MQLQAATYNNSLQSLAAMLNEWKDAANNYLQKIAEAEQQGKPTAGMEIYHNKQMQRIQIIETAISNADAYIFLITDEIERLRERMSAAKQQQISTTERVRIIDLPHSADYYHNNIMEQLFEIKEIIQRNGKEKK